MGRRVLNSSSLYLLYLIYDLLPLPLVDGALWDCSGHAGRADYNLNFDNIMPLKIFIIGNGCIEVMNFPITGQ